MKKLIGLILRRFDFEIRRIQPQIKTIQPAQSYENKLEQKRQDLFNDYIKYYELNDFSINDIELIESVKSFTMTGPLRMFSLIKAVEYIIENNIDGAFVECGVWKGGSMMLIAKKLMELGIYDRELFLYDTYEGMTEPTSIDIGFDNIPASQILNEFINNNEDTNKWCYSSIEEVKENILNTGYNPKLIHFIKGKVEDTIPDFIPIKISLLRLDTDWYDSTLHELNHLYHLLQKKGVLVIDDYGQWLGQKKAVDEFFSEKSYKPMLSRIDFSSRLMIKID